MMFGICLLNGFRMGGAMFTLRNDIIMDSETIAKGIFLYCNGGIKLIIRNICLEEPSQMEGRAVLTK